MKTTPSQDEMDHTNTDKSAKKGMPDEAGLSDEEIEERKLPRSEGDDPSKAGTYNLQEVLKRMERRVINVDNTGQETNTDIKELKTSVTDLSAEVDANKKETSDLKKEMATLKKEMQQVKAEMTNVKKKRTEANEENTTREEIYTRAK